MDRTRVVVGYDGSGHADLAVRWAAVEAARRGAPLAVVAATEVSWDEVSRPEEIERSAWTWAETVAAQGAARAREAAPSVDVVTKARLAHPVDALATASEDAALVVVGSRGHGSFTGALLGSVAYAISGQSACPVVVVRRNEPLDPGFEHPVVVGVDGSAAATAALDTACDLASSWGAPLTVLAAWQVSATESWALAYGGTAMVTTDLVTDAERTAGDIADRAATRARSRHPGLAVTTLLPSASPAQALVHTSHGARLVVVGARGRGRLSSLLLGSVSHATIHGATCPVAVVRATKD